jgi:hypothetical protein
LTLVLLPFGAVLVASAGPPLGGNASCPRPDEVAALLATMLPEDAAPPARLARPPGEAGGDRGEIFARGLETVVRLTDGSGAIVDESVLEGSCEERAHRAAVLLAIWQTRMTVAAPDAVASPPAPAPAAVASIPASPREDVHGRGAAVRLGAAAAASADTAGLAPTGLLEIEAQPWAARTWGRLAVEDTGEKSLTLGRGDVKWTRLALGTGAVMDLGTGRFGTSLRGDLLVSRVSVHGDGFTTNRQGAVWQVGADFGLRFHVSLSPRASIWLDLSAVAWPGQQVLSVGSVTSTRSLPALEGRLGLGGTFPLTP